MIGSTQTSGQEHEIGGQNQCKRLTCQMYLGNTFPNGLESCLILIIYHSSSERTVFYEIIFMFGRK
jgi:hypothetical protein